MSENLTDRTFAVFSTSAYEAGHVYDETVRTHARAVLEPLRDRLVATGRTASTVDDHSQYGVAFSLDDRAGGTIEVLLQCVDPWLLTLTRQLTLRDRCRRAKADEVDIAFVTAIDAALKAVGASSVVWFSEAEFSRAASALGPVATNFTS